MDKSVLENVVDIHVHTGPEAHKNRKFNEYELAEEAISCKARALIIKTHAFETASRAKLVSEKYPEIKIFGGIALNNEVGGLNPFAVDGAISLGGKIVWLPTKDSNHERVVRNQTGGIVCVQDGKTVPVLDEILKLIADADIILATGHLSWQDQVVVVKRAHELGVKRILVNHPTLHRIAMPVEVQKSLMPYGVYFERNYGGSKLPDSSVFEKHFDRNIADIKALGASTSIMATDLGQPFNPSWSDGFAEYIHYVLEHGVSEQDVVKMTQKNPAAILGL